MVKLVNSSDFENEVLKSTGRVIVDFYADWCAECSALSPVVEEARESDKNTKFIKINCDEGRQLALDLGVFSIPTLVLFVDGKERSRLVGLVEKEDIINM